MLRPATLRRPAAAAATELSTVRSLRIAGKLSKKKQAELRAAVERHAAELTARAPTWAEVIAEFEAKAARRRANPDSDDDAEEEEEEQVPFFYEPPSSRGGSPPPPPPPAGHAIAV